MSQHHDLLRFLTESAKEASRRGSHAEAEELLTLRARVTARHFDLRQLQLPLDAKAAA